MGARHRFRWVAFLLSIALLASVALNFIIFTQAKQYYLQLNETRLDPLGRDYFASHTSQTNLFDSGKMMVVFFGDSRAADWPPPPDITHFQFVNRGIGAQTSAQTLERFNYHIRPLHPRIVILQVGINDLKTIQLFPERKEVIISNCEQNIGRIVTQSMNIGATVILTTIFPLSEIPLERKPFWSPDVAQAVDKVNTYIRSLKAQNVIVFDAYSVLTNRKPVRETYLDELHLNAIGYEVLNNELSRVLETLE